MALVSMRQLLESGVHFGHQTRRWNPKMKRFIFGERNGIYIIDLQKTLHHFQRAYEFIKSVREELTPEDALVLCAVPRKQLEQMIDGYRVDPRAARVATKLLVTLGVLAALAFLVLFLTVGRNAFWHSTGHTNSTTVERTYSADVDDF